MTTVVVTGASSGLGLEVTRVLAAGGAHVVMACRSVSRGRQVAPAGSVSVRRLDLADLSSMRDFAAGLDEIDVLVNNAGVMAVPWGLTADGFERHLGVNHLGHFALTGLLLDRIRDRVVTVTSGLHVLAGLLLRGRWSAYAESKLANLLFAYELDRRVPRLRSLAAHPGVAGTEGQRRDTSLTGRILAGGPPQTPAQGALPLLHAATADLPGGVCIGPDGRFQRTGHPTVVRTSRRSHDPALARALWAHSEHLTGVRYDIAPMAASGNGGGGGI